MKLSYLKSHSYKEFSIANLESSEQGFYINFITAFLSINKKPFRKNIFSAYFTISLRIHALTR